jgi:hypothetical protein
MEADVDLIVVDSISALLPAIYFEKDGNELKDLQDTKQIGAEAKDMTHAVKMLNYANKNTLLVLISQQRNQFGSMHASHIPTGGMAVKFFSSTVIKLWSSEAEANAIKAGIKVGDKIIEQRVGRPVNWIIDYNKLGPPNLSGQYDFYYQGEATWYRWSWRNIRCCRNVRSRGKRWRLVYSQWRKISGTSKSSAISS